MTKIQCQTTDDQLEPTFDRWGDILHWPVIRTTICFGEGYENLEITLPALPRRGDELHVSSDVSLIIMTVERIIWFVPAGGGKPEIYIHTGRIKTL